MTHDLYRVIFHVASALEIPVIVVALLALALVVVELGRFAVELVTRRQGSRGSAGVARLDAAGGAARAALAAGDAAAARRALAPVACSGVMRTALDAFVGHAAVSGTDAERTAADARLAKDLAEVDFAHQRRLNVTRLLVRVGPALGLMGTLIPLSPALDGLAKGNTTALSDNLRIAFSITVLGLLVGALAFALSLVRDRLYGQDYSDLEYVAAALSVAAAPAPAADPAGNPAPTHRAHG